MVFFCLHIVHNSVPLEWMRSKNPCTLVGGYEPVYYPACLASLLEETHCVRPSGGSSVSTFDVDSSFRPLRRFGSFFLQNEKGGIFRVVLRECASNMKGNSEYRFEKLRRHAFFRPQNSTPQRRLASVVTRPQSSERVSTKSLVRRFARAMRQLMTVPARSRLRVPDCDCCWARGPLIFLFPCPAPALHPSACACSPHFRSLLVRHLLLHPPRPD